MPYYLVEEHTTTMGINEKIPFHESVWAPNIQAAFQKASEKSPVGGFMFAAEELAEVVPNYLWAAADGSDIWYEVRRVK